MHAVLRLRIRPEEPAPDRALEVAAAGPQTISHGGVLLSSRIATCGKQRRQAAQSVVPERLNLDRLADTRRYHEVADLGVHPRELYARLTGS
jgi:hypothetical protein